MVDVAAAIMVKVIVEVMVLICTYRRRMDDMSKQNSNFTSIKSVFLKMLKI